MSPNPFAQEDAAQRLQSIFFRAIEIPSAKDRRRFVNRQCSDRPELRREINELLEAHQKAGDFLRDDDCDLTGSDDTRPQLAEFARLPQGSKIGTYTIGRILGEGGFGVVYEAEQSDPVNRRVAIKVIKPGMDTREVLSRFDTERKTLALMNHPNIAKVLDAGSTDEGRPYFVMECVDGSPITDYCNHAGLSIEQRLKLFGDVCHAVQHAHQKGILHRDLKPSNLLVGEFDGKATVKVIDFGVAKALESAPDGSKTITRVGQLIGTPLYISPEQARSPGEIDTRTDVYSLGTVLYELLVGQTPYNRTKLQRADLVELQRILREDEPPKPSLRSVEIEGVDASRLRGDLDWLVMKAIEKDPDRRYPTVDALAVDLKRYLKSEPISAGPPTNYYRFSKFVQRHRAAFAFSALLLLSLVGGAAIATRQAVRATVAERLAEDRLAEVREEQQRTNQALRQARQAEAEQRSLRQLAEQRDRYSRQLLYSSDLRLAGQALQDGDFRGFVDQLDRQRPTPETTDLRGFEWWFLRHLAVADYEPLQPPGSGTCLARFTRDGRFLVSGHYNGKIRLYDAATLKPLRTLQGHDSFANGIDLSPDGKTLASTGDDGFLRFWDLASGKEIRKVKADQGHVHRVWYALDGKLLLSSGEAPEVKVWDPSTLEIIDRLGDFATSKHHGIKQRLVCSPDRTRCVAADQFKTARVYDLKTREVICTLDVESTRFIRCLNFSPDGRWIAGGRYDQEITIWDAETGQVIERLVGHLDDVQDIAFHPDGNLIASSDKSGVVRTWRIRRNRSGDDNTDNAVTGNTRTANWPKAFVAHEDRVWSLDFSPDGNTLVTGCRDGTLRAWTARPAHRFATGLTDLEPQAIWIDDDHLIVTGEKELVFWNLESGTTQSSGILPDRIQSIVLSPGGRTFATGHENGRVKIWNTHSRTIEYEDHLHDETVHALAYMPQGEALISCGHDGQVILRQAAAKDPLVLYHFDDLCKTVAVSPTQPLIAVAVQNDLYLFDLGGLSDSKKSSMQPIRLSGHQNSVDSIAFSHDGTMLASAGDDRTIRLWNIANRTAEHVIYAHQSKIESIAFSPDGKTIVSGDKDCEIAFTHAETGQLLSRVDLLERWSDLDILRESPWISDLKFSPDGSRILTAVFQAGYIVLNGPPNVLSPPPD